MRGGRMLEREFRCTFDLFSGVPTLDGSKTVTQEIFDRAKLLPSVSKARLVRDGRKLNAPLFELWEHHILALERVALKPESMLGRSSIAEQFDPSFFGMNFWLMWCTTFAFQPWHSAA